MGSLYQRGGGRRLTPARSGEEQEKQRRPDPPKFNGARAELDRVGADTGSGARTRSARRAKLAT
jgi:hypothetical protein